MQIALCFYNYQCICFILKSALGKEIKVHLNAGSIYATTISHSFITLVFGIFCLLERSLTNQLKCGPKWKSLWQKQRCRTWSQSFKKHFRNWWKVHRFSMNSSAPYHVMIVMPPTFRGMLGVNFISLIWITLIWIISLPHVCIWSSTTHNVWIPFWNTFPPQTHIQSPCWLLYWGATYTTTRVYNKQATA